MAKHVKFTKVGDWGKVKRLTVGLKQDMSYTRTEALKDWGFRAMQVAKGHIDSQDLGWADLAEYTLNRKAALGYPSDIMIETKTYYDNIKFWINGRGYQSDTAYAGVQQGIAYKTGQNKDTGLTVGDIAVTHEFGAWELNVPARPLWTPTSEEMNEQYTMDILEDSLHILSMRLNKKYGMTNIHVL